MLPPEAFVMPPELVAVDGLLDDPRFFEPFRRCDPSFGRPSIPWRPLRLMFLKYRYRLGCESLCAEVSDSLTWLRFCRIPLSERAPRPSTFPEAGRGDRLSHLAKVQLTKGSCRADW